MKERKLVSTNHRENNNHASITNISQFSFAEKEVSLAATLGLKDDEINENNSLISSGGKDFIGKKRKHLTRIYQNIIDKNLNKDNSQRNLDKENIKDQNFITYDL